MCFSAAGSFTLSGILAGVGAVGVARNSSKSFRLFSAMPLLFAAQQSAEGVVWLTFPPSDHELVHRVAALAFLAVAMVIWPLWVTLALRAAERQPARRRGLTALACLGGVVAVLSVVTLVRSPPVALIAGHSIHYASPPIGSAAVGMLVTLAYLVPTIGPFFVSSLRLARTIGATLIVSLVLTLVLERETMTSVWCFFAAILSLQTLVALHGERRAAPVAPVTARRAGFAD